MQIDLVHNCLLPFAKIFAKYENSIEPEKPDNSTVFNSLMSAIENIYYYISDEIKKRIKNSFLIKDKKIR